MTRFPLFVTSVFYGLMALIAALLAALFDTERVLEPFPGSQVPINTAFLIGAAVGLGFTTASRVADRMFAWSRRLTADLKSVLGPLRPSDVFALAVLSALGEEIFFRGFLLPAIGLPLSSLVFALLHGFSPGSWKQTKDGLRRFLPLMVAAASAGFAFGLLVEYTGNIAAAVIAHFTVNFLNLSAMFRDDWAKEGDTRHGR